MAALLAIARDEKPEGIVTAMDVLTIDAADDWVEVVDGSGGEDPELEKLVLWVEIRKQVKILREGLNQGDGEGESEAVDVDL